MSDPAHEAPASAPTSEPDGSLTSPSFLALVATQFLGAVNDNMFRWFVIGIAKHYVDQQDTATTAAVLSAGLACFVVPYLLLAAPAGYLADRFSKRQVIVGCKVAEVVIMALGIGAVLVSNQVDSFYPMFVVVFLMGSQSALFGPAKLGSVPEIVKASKISSANGVLGLFTVIATAVGFAAGNYLSDVAGERGVPQLYLPALALVGLAVAGITTSLGIRRLVPANPHIRFPFDAVSQTVRDLQTLASNRAMLRVALGIAFFWSLGSLCQMNIDQFGIEGGLEQRQLFPLLTALVFGVGLGSVLAGVWSGGKVELGILPLGAAGIVLSSVLLFTVEGVLRMPNDDWTAMHVWACLWLFTLGVSAGLFDVPLAAYMQHRSPTEKRGAILAASNFLTFAGMALIAGVFAILKANFTARQIFLICGLATVPVLVYALWLLPQNTIRFVVWLASRTIYRVRVFDHDHLPERGGALLVANHVSWLDGVMLLLASSRHVRMIAYAPIVNQWWSRWISRTMQVIAIREGPKSIRAALAEAREAVLAGDLVCIFPEGRITRNGQLGHFKPGLLRVVEGTGAPVVPVFLDELWGSIFSYRDGNSFWTWPRRVPYPVSIHFGEPLATPQEVAPVRTALEKLASTAVMRRRDEDMNLPRMMLRSCRRRGSTSKAADSSGADLSGRQLLLRTFVLRRLLLRNVLGADEKFVGVLLPPSVGGVVTNAALSLCGRVPVNLNYTVSPGVFHRCIEQCGIRHVLTSRKFVEKLRERGDFPIDVEVVYLEDFADAATVADKLAAVMGAYVTPISLLVRQLGVADLDPDEVFTIIFTSGSTGDPKGVQLTLRNIASNVIAVDEAVHLRHDDVFLGVLPFFHSFGFTVTLWTVLTLDIKGIYHFNPLDSKQIGKLCERHGCTIAVATPTFLRGIVRRCGPEQLAALEVMVTGAEKLPTDLADAFEKKFGVRPLEGYGTTELSPLVSVNVPPTRAVSDPGGGVREGTVGRPVSGVCAKTVDPETGEDLPLGEMGMLLITGPNVMKGYLHKPELTAEVIRDGWYVTGDLARIDEDGFIQITGRESRFSKIGGEMVPHIRIEEELAALLGSAPHDDDAEDEAHGMRAVVTAVPDERKGERLIVLHLPIEKSPEELCQGLKAAGLPPLWIPAHDSFFEVAEFPHLGTGKIDLKQLQQQARELTGTAE
ncbi:MAG: MFS transporter [Planctomycetota bacterium]|nr:MAG: MFS transporter [Planctomycetota bacterium]REK40648.1 MAG: MFS transporter [Planctomycetota bacterium]